MSLLAVSAPASNEGRRTQLFSCSGQPRPQCSVSGMFVLARYPGHWPLSSFPLQPPPALSPQTLQPFVTNCLGIHNPRDQKKSGFSWALSMRIQMHFPTGTHVPRGRGCFINVPQYTSGSTADSATGSVPKSWSTCGPAPSLRSSQGLPLDRFCIHFWFPWLLPRWSEPRRTASSRSALVSERNWHDRL